MQLSPGRSEVIKKEKKGTFERLFNLHIFKSKTREAELEQSEETRQLLESISDTKREWERANINFEYADCQEAVDYYTYMIKANEVMYEYLLKKAKEKGLKVEMIESIDCSPNKNMI